METELYELVVKLFGNDNLETKTFEEILIKLEDYFKSKIHILAARYKLHNQRMKELRCLARNCAFNCKNVECNADFVDEMIRDAIILHMPHEAVRTAALQKQNPTLAEVLSLAEAYESAQKSLAILEGNSADVNIIKPHKKHFKHKGKPGYNNFYKKQQRKLLPSCSGCFKDHKKENCRFRSAKCHNCGKIGHIAPVCIKKSINIVDHSEEEVINVNVNKNDIQFQFDTGSSCSMINLKTYHLFKELTIIKSHTILKANGNKNIPVLGMLNVKVKLGSKT